MPQKAPSGVPVFKVEKFVKGDLFRGSLNKNTGNSNLMANVYYRSKELS